MYASAAPDAPKGPLSKEEIHTYARAMMAAMDNPEFQARVRTAMSRAPVPSNSEAVMDRYEEVQADYFTNYYNTCSGTASEVKARDDVSSQEKLEGESEPEQALSGKLDEMNLQGDTSRGDRKQMQPTKLDGTFIMEQLRQAVNIYKDSETERIITQLCMLMESKVTALPATVPALKHLYVESVHGRGAADAAAACRASGENHMPIVNPSPQMMSMMEMAMKTLTPVQRATLERAQQAMMSGRPPSAEDMRDMFLIQRQLGAFMQTLQQFGQMPGGRGGGRGGRGK
ncbi:hypothetical protein ABL78_0224 [Leptomonas seymouri]|uniref:Uncharacterized protein n=1 Tax=Leptomonas seymouri TaxID=5684 RepID=A0A0N1IMT4_LEPSE|nr:hypothetical protein ABL78_0224 [Leptomonas seymouri]|eukprot:KPI90628.1 hypothetical protein ABL78_0224 [Leptomonas seymouri]